MDHRIAADVPVAVEPDAEGDRAEVLLLADLPAGETLRVSKSVAYHWAPRRAARDLLARVDGTLDRATAAGHAAVEAAHARARRRVLAPQRRRDRGRARGPAGRALQPLLAHAGHGPQRGPRRRRQGRDGPRLRGPVLLGHRDLRRPVPHPHEPGLGAAGLEFRCGMLDAARARAREIGHGGAAFPWRTINGEEASAWYAAGTAQYHVNADIAYAMRHYAWVTGDLGFVLERGRRGAGRDRAAVDGARVLLRAPRRAFCINGVTGPDEYTTVVDNNAYTNLMARENLEGAVRVIEWLQARTRTPTRGSCAPPGSTPAEVEGWRRAAELMYVPRHAELGIVLQDEHFLDREPWDFEAHAARGASAPAPLPPARALPPPGDQADRRRARHLPRRPRVQRGGDPAHVRLLRRADDGRLDALGVRAERHGLGGRLPRRGARLLPRRAAPSTSPTPTATPPTASTSRPAAARGSRSSPASAGCATSTARSGSTRGCRPSGTRLRFRIQRPRPAARGRHDARGRRLPAGRGHRC